MSTTAIRPASFTSPTGFITSLPWTEDFLWQGKTGTLVLDEDRRVTLTLDDVGTRDHFNGMRAKLVSKTNGEIVVKWFAFDDHLDPADRLDGREHRFEGHKSFGHPYPGNTCYYAWRNSGNIGWYIANPATPSDFTEAVEEWIATWR